jgi:hypothetical protein
MFVNVLVATTSVGVIVLSLKALISAEGGLSAFHPSWRNRGLLFSSDKKLQLCRLSLVGCSDCDETVTPSPRPTSTRRNSMLQTRTRQHSRVNSARSLTAAPPPVPASVQLDEKDPYNPTGLVQLEVIEEHSVMAEGVGSTAHSQSTNPPPQPTTTLQRQGPATGRSNALLLACVTSRPVFRASPSGRYCAVHWPESLYYVVLEMPAELLSQEGGGHLSSKMKEIDRGQCLSLGWMAIPIDSHSPAPQQKDLLFIVSTSKRIDGTKKKKQYSLFKKKDTTPEGCLPAMLLLRSYLEDGKVQETVVSGGPADGVEEIYGGSSLLCVNSVSKMNDSGASDEKRKAISKIELEAMQAQQAAEAAATGGGSGGGSKAADEIPVHVSYKSQFFALTLGTKLFRHSSSASSAPTMDESTSVSDSVSTTSAPTGDLVLTPLGPILDRVSAVAWDTVRDTTPSSLGSTTSQYLAVLIGTRVNLLQLLSTESAMSLSTVRSIDVSSCSRVPPTSLLWREGFLFVSTFQEVVAIFPRPVPPVHSPRADSATLCSLTTPTQVPLFPPLFSSPRQAIVGSPGQLRPYGWLEIGSIVDGCALLISKDCVLTPVPLASNTLVSILLHLARMARNGSDSERLRAAAQFLPLLPPDMRDYLMGLFASW